MRWRLFLLVLLPAAILSGQEAPETTTTLRPARVFDGDAVHDGWAVRVRGGRIEAAGPAATIGGSGTVLDLPGMTLMPGMIEGHSHVFLHAYNETSWNDQVLKESLGVRTARAVNPGDPVLHA